jgi:hypothetical protein
MKLGSAPRQGDGLHSWLLVQSRRLLVLGWTVDAVVRVLIDAAEASNRTTQDLHSEIENAVLGAKEFLDANPGWQEKIDDVIISVSRQWIDPYTWVGLGDCRRDGRTYRKVSPDSGLLARALAWGRGKLVLGSGVKSFNFYDLFAGIDFVICACVDMNKPEYRRFNQWNPDLSNNFRCRQYIVPNYMHPDVLTDGIDDGKHDLNVGRRLYMVIEADKGSVEDQLAMLAYIEKRCKVRLAMAVFSGGKSVHGWFCVWGVSEYRITSIHILAKKLGADKTTHSPGQYVRMPRGWNYGKDRRQKILWYSKAAVLAQKVLVEGEVLLWN